MAKAVRIEITLSPERAKALDGARGLVPRASFIKAAIDAFIAADAMSTSGPPRVVSDGGPDVLPLDVAAVAASPSHENGAAAKPFNIGPKPPAKPRPRGKAK